MAAPFAPPAPDPATFPPRNDRVEEIDAWNWGEAQNRHWSYRSVDRLGLRLAGVSRGTGPVHKFGIRPADLSGVRVTMFGREMSLVQLQEALDSHGFLVVKDDAIVHESYGNGMEMEDRHSLQSISKTAVAAVIGDLVSGGAIDLARKVRHYLPQIGPGYADATLQDVLDMNVSNDFSEDYGDPGADVYTSEAALGFCPDPDNAWPGGNRQYLCTITGADVTGTGATQYKSPNSDLLAWIVEEVTGRPFLSLFEERVWSRLGAAQSLLCITDATGFPAVSGGFAVTLRDLARYGWLWARCGISPTGERLIDERWVASILDNADGTEYTYPGFRYHNQVVTDGRVICHGGWAGQFMWADTLSHLVIAIVSGYRNPAGMDEEVLSARLQVCRGIAAALA